MISGWSMKMGGTSPTMKWASCGCAVNRPPLATGISARNRATRLSASGLALATNTCRRADGVYTYCGRTDDMFKVSGIWVSPFEVEGALVSHPKVLEAAVVPVEDDNGLIKPKAFVVLKNQRDNDAGRALYEELKVHVKRAIGPWKYPRWIEFVDSLPKTATGKIQRFMLRDKGLNLNGGDR